MLYCIFEQRKQKQIFIYIFCAIVKGLKLFRESLTTKQTANIEIYDLVRLMFGTDSICYQRPKAGYET